MARKQHKPKKGLHPHQKASAPPHKSLPAEKRLQYAQEALDAVFHAIQDFNTAPTLSRRKTAIRNFVEQGRSVTWILENLKSEFADAKAFDLWWAEARHELVGDPVARFFYELRNFIIKEGELEVGNVAHIRKYTVTPETPRPEGAVGFAIKMDGTPTWVMGDGTEQAAHTSLGQVVRWTTIEGLPDEFQSHPLPLLMQRYAEVLRRTVAFAYARFGVSG